jgi:hypothetical protein
VGILRGFSTSTSISITSLMSSPPEASSSSTEPVESGIRILLPSHSYSFTVDDLGPDATISELKRAIFEACPGRPKQSGQRIIVGGRLMQDNEAVVSEVA